MPGLALLDPLFTGEPSSVHEALQCKLIGLSQAVDRHRDPANAHL
jgi:hypothetical protein